MFCLNTKDNLGKFGVKSYEAIFVGNSNSNKVYRVFSRSTLTIEESKHVKFDECKCFVKNIINCHIDSLSEDLEKISMKESPTQEENRREEPSGQAWEVQEETQPT